MHYEKNCKLLLLSAYCSFWQKQPIAVFFSIKCVISICLMDYSSYSLMHGWHSFSSDYQTEKTKGFSPVCNILCFFRSPGAEKALLHWLQPKGFSPVWDILCFFRLLDSEKALSHWVQPKGFSPVCDILCFLRLPDRKKALLHWVQTNGFFPVSSGYLTHCPLWKVS